MECSLNAWQCHSCEFEFVILCLNGPQNDFNGDPACPKCNDPDEVHKIDCLDFKMSYQELQYGITIKPKPLVL